MAWEGRGGAVAAVSRRGLSAQAALRPAADRGHRPRSGTGPAGRSARRRLTPGAAVPAQGRLATQLRVMKAYQAPGDNDNRGPFGSLESRTTAKASAVATSTQPPPLP